MAGSSGGWRQRIRPEGIPVVSDLARASRLLAVPEDRLAAAIRAAQVDMWGLDAHHRPVYSWERLLELARSLGVQPPAALDPERRRAASPMTVKQRRGRANQARSRGQKAKR